MELQRAAKRARVESTKKALVIGMGYKGVEYYSPLKNAVNDATDMGDLLKSTLCATNKAPVLVVVLVFATNAVLIRSHSFVFRYWLRCHGHH